MIHPRPKLPVNLLGHLGVVHVAEPYPGLGLGENLTARGGAGEGGGDGEAVHVGHLAVYLVSVAGLRGWTGELVRGGGQVGVSERDVGVIKLLDSAVRKSEENKSSEERSG